MIIIPIKWLFHWEYTQHFQTNPYPCHVANQVEPGEIDLDQLEKCVPNLLKLIGKLEQPIPICNEAGILDHGVANQWGMIPQYI